MSKTFRVVNKSNFDITRCASSLREGGGDKLLSAANTLKIIRHCPVFSLTKSVLQLNTFSQKRIFRRHKICVDQWVRPAIRVAVIAGGRNRGKKHRRLCARKL